MNYRSLGRMPAVMRVRSAWPYGSSYRYPTELWMLMITVLIIGMAIFSSAVFSIWGFFFFVLIGMVINYFFIRSIIEGFKRDAVQVTNEQFPELKALIDDCRRHIDIPPDTRVFVSYSPYMNAFSVGLGRPYMIVLFSALIDNLDADELKYVIGHEMGHIKFGHTILLTLIGQLGSRTYGIPILRDLFYIAFLFWSRAAELTADRAGLVGGGRLDKAISAQVKMGAGPWLAQQVDARALAQQAREATGNFFAAFVEMWGSHPLMTTRIRRLVNFATSEDFVMHRPDAQRTTTPQSGPGQSAASSQSKKRRVLRRLTPRDNIPAIPHSIAVDPSESTAEAVLESEPQNPEATNPDPAAKAGPIEWGKEIGFNRLNVSAIRANAEQAEMWLRLGELLQSYGQADEAALCLRRARTLINGPTLPTPGDDLSFQSRDLIMATGQHLSLSGTPSILSACPTCRTTNPAGTHYCHHCQTQLQKQCLECETWLPVNYPNCSHCGQNQAQIIATLKAEADDTLKAAQQAMPPRRLTKWEVIYGSIFLIDVIVGLLALAWQSYAISPGWAYGYFIGAFLTLQLGIFIATTSVKRRTRQYWRVYDEVDFATHRYNEIADLLARQNVILSPPRITPKDPWRWAHSK